MHFSLPLIIAGAASLCTAAPVISTDNPVLEKRMDIGNDVTPFLSGETMNMDQIQKGVNIWCSSMNGQVVPLGKSLNSQVPDFILRSGGPGVLAAHYTNNKIRIGWVINEGECNTWMMQVARLVTRGRNDLSFSQGGYGMVGDLGSIWIDPNAQ